MNETERNILLKEFKGYLEEILAWDYNEQVAYFLREVRKLPFPKDVQDIFITSCPQDDQTMLEDLWVFLKGYCIKVKGFLEVEKGTEPEIIELVPLKGEAKCVRITKQNFSFQTESGRRREPKPRLEISIKLHDDQTLDFKAVEAVNCKHLLGIYRKYFAPLFPV
jgi:hypothetical protein